MKKILLTLGTVAAIAIPIASVISCGTTLRKKNGQDDGNQPNTSGMTSEEKKADANAAAHAKEVIATSKLGTKANNIKGENLTRPFTDIADTQDEHTVYQVAATKTTIAQEFSFIGKDVDLTSNPQINQLDTSNVNTLKLTIGEHSNYGIEFDLKNIKPQKFSIKTDGTYFTYFIASLDSNLKLHLELDPTKASRNRHAPADFSSIKVKDISFVSSSKRYWSSKIPTHVTPIQFKWNADECHSIKDIISQMNSQLHFNFQYKLEKMTPINFADYIVNLTRNNGGGEWDFKVNYKGESDDVNINPAPVLNRFIKALDGDENPTKSSDWHFKAISDKTPLGHSSGVGAMLGKANISAFMDMLQQHADVLPKDLGPVYSLMENFPNDALNVFPDFLNLFTNMGQAFHDSPTALKWAKDQDHETQVKFADIKNEIIRTVLSSGK